MAETAFNLYSGQWTPLEHCTVQSGGWVAGTLYAYGGCYGVAVETNDAAATDKALIVEADRIAVPCTGADGTNFALGDPVYYDVCCGNQVIADDNAGANPIIGSVQVAADSGDTTVIITLRGTPTKAIEGSVVRHVDSTVTLAELNAGKTILAADAAKTIKVISVRVQFTGTFTTCTLICLGDTAGTPVVVAGIAVAEAATGAIIASHSTCVECADIAWTAIAPTALTAAKGLQVYKTGSAAAGGTSLAISVTYCYV